MFVLWSCCIQTNFSFNTFRPQQLEVLRAVHLLRKDTLAVLGTGYGKSLIYQLVGLECRSNRMVVCLLPTLDLIADAYHELSRFTFDCPVVALGGVDNHQSDAVAAEGKYKFGLHTYCSTYLPRVSHVSGL